MKEYFRYQTLCWDFYESALHSLQIPCPINWINLQNNTNGEFSFHYLCIVCLFSKKPCWSCYYFDSIIFCFKVNEHLDFFAKQKLLFFKHLYIYHLQYIRVVQVANATRILYCAVLYIVAQFILMQIPSQKFGTKCIFQACALGAI